MFTRKIIIAIVLFVSVFLLISGVSCAPQGDYNSLIVENENLEEYKSSAQSRIKKLEKENSTLKTENLDLQIKVHQLEEANQYLREKIEENSTPEPEPVEAKLYEDEFVTVSYVGFGKGADFPYEERECLIFRVENKTETTLEFSPSSVALDGVDTGELFCRNELAPKSTGKIYLLKMNDSNQKFENKTPTKITCEMSIRDYSEKGVFGENTDRHSISFIDIEIREAEPSEE